MQGFERMVTIPEDEYKVLRSMQQVQDPLQTHFHRLTKEYSKQDAIKDPHDRVFRKGEILDEMIRTKDSLRDRLMEATPRPYQNRADSLFKFMQDKIRFNEKGEIYNNDDDVIAGSNIADLVQHAVRDRRRQLTPMGWQTFLTQLKDANAPKMVMNYDTLEELNTPIAQRERDPTPITPIMPRRRSRAPSRSPKRGATAPRGRGRGAARGAMASRGRGRGAMSVRDNYLQPPPHLRKPSTRPKKSPEYLRDYFRF